MTDHETLGSAGEAPQFITVGQGAAARRIAYLRTPPKSTPAGAGRRPGVFWLSGFKSDMISTKASEIAEWGKPNSVAVTRFDYSGHGQSGGRFEDGTLSLWLEEAVAAFCELTSGPQIIVGSSMGGFLAMLLERELARSAPVEARRIHAIVLIAPAWDMTEVLMWEQFPQDVRDQIEANGVWLRPSAYGDPYPITRGLIEDGRRHAFAGTTWTPACPVRIIHGRLDPDVPFAHGEKLVTMMPGVDVELIEVPDGEHRLSRPEDIELMLATISSLL